MLLLVGMLWFAYSIITFTLKEASNENRDYIPKNAFSVSRIDGQVFFKKTLKTLILHQDTDLSAMLREIKQNSTSTGMEPLGISFDSEIIQFKIDHKTEILTGYLLNLRSPHYFKRNIRNFIGPDAAISTNGNIGLILLQSEGNLKKSKLQAIANDILSKKSTFSNNNPTPNPSSILTLWNKSKQGQIFSLGASIDKESLQISGSITDNAIHIQKYHWLKPEGLHISSAVIPDSWNEYIQKSFGEVGVELPKIASISMNYFGCTFISDPVFLIAPMADISLTFEATILIDSLFKAFELSTVGAPKDFKKLNVYGENYLVSSPAPNQLKIYHSSLDKIRYEQTSNALQAKGSPKYIFTIEGDGFIKRLMGLSPTMSASQAIVSQVSLIDISGEISKNGSVVIDGKVQFKKGSFPLNEIFKFLIRSKTFE